MLRSHTLPLLAAGSPSHCQPAWQYLNTNESSWGGSSGRSSDGRTLQGMWNPRVHLPPFFPRRKTSLWKPSIQIREGWCRRCPRLYESNIQLQTMAGHPECQVAAVSQDYKNSGQRSLGAKASKICMEATSDSFTACNSMVNQRSFNGRSNLARPGRGCLPAPPPPHHPSRAAVKKKKNKHTDLT